MMRRVFVAIGVLAICLLAVRALSQTIEGGFTINGQPYSFSGTISAVPTPTATPTATATATPTATATDTPTATPTATATPIPSPVPLFFMGTRTTSYLAPSGITWSADQGYDSGSQYVKADAITGTTTPTLYQASHCGGGCGVNNATFTYSFNTSANGAYRITLKYAEKWWTSAGKRQFDVTINGATVESNFDIYAAAGGKDIAVDRTYPVTVSGNMITVSFVQKLDDPEVSAIEIDGPSGALIAPAPKVAATINSTASVSLTDPTDGTVYDDQTDQTVTWTVNIAQGLAATFYAWNAVVTNSAGGVAYSQWYNPTQASMPITIDFGALPDDDYTVIFYLYMRDGTVALAKVVA